MKDMAENKSADISRAASGSVGNLFSGLGSAALGAGIGTLGDIGTTLLNNYFQKKQFDREVAHEQATYERNRQDYLSDLASEREYNSPQSQINRLREAGLNPNLVGNNSLTTGRTSSSTPMGNGNNIGMSPVSMSNPLGVGILAQSTSDVMRANSDAKRASDYANAQLQSQLGITEKEFRPIRRALMRAQEAEANGNANMCNKHADYYVAQTIGQLRQNEWIDQHNQATINNLKKQGDYFTESGKTQKALAVLYGLQKDYEQFRVNHQQSEWNQDQARKWISCVGALGCDIVQAVTFFKSLGKGMPGGMMQLPPIEQNGRQLVPAQTIQDQAWQEFGELLESML